MINQAIHTLDALLWLLGDATAVAGRSSRHVLDDEVDVEDTAHLVIDHATGARSVFFATVANVVDSPVTMEIITEQATCYLRGDLTIRYADGRIDQVPERVAASGGRAYWGVSHELLIDDFYRRLGRSRAVLDLTHRSAEVARSHRAALCLRPARSRRHPGSRVSSSGGPQPDRFRFAVVGAGVIGNHHGKVIGQLADQIELVVVVDHHAERAERIVGEHGGRAFTSLTDALAATGVDVVVVCTPTGIPGEVAIEALAGGQARDHREAPRVTLASTDQMIAA